MACTSSKIRTMTTNKRTVFSLGGADPGTSDIHVLSADPMIQIAPMVARIRITTIVENATPDISIQPVVQTTKDGLTWESAGSVGGSAITQNGTTVSAWLDSLTLLRGMRTGVTVSQANSADVIQMAHVQQIIDIELT